MYYVYVLQSQVDKRLYVGKTNNLKIRFSQHNNGHVKSTKPFQPWILVYYEAYRNPSDISKREKQLKLHAAKEALKIQIKSSMI